MENTPPTYAAPAGAPEDKTAAILAYLTVLGFIIAVVLHGQKKTSLGSYHLRQALGIYLAGIAAGLLNVVIIWIPLIGLMAIGAIWLLFVVCWVMGLIAAAQGERKPVPVFGETIQKMLGNAFD